jgi:unsaturated chondroitin disaccharide hydrolase
LETTVIRLDPELTLELLKPRLEHLFEVSASKIRALAKAWDLSRGAPVITVEGAYTSRSWTEWTQGFQFGSALLQFDATRENWLFEYGRKNTLQSMARQVSNVGGHDHGFNNISTYGNLLRLAREGKTPEGEAEQEYYRLALKVSGAVQAARWTQLADGRGYIYSFRGPHSLFVDTIRSLRSLAAAHRLGQTLMSEAHERVSLLRRLLDHASVTSEYAVFYGDGRDRFDVRGRVAHESLFNAKTGTYCCPSTEQGYSPFTTWTRGLAWAMLGFAEQLEFLATLPPADLEPLGGQATIQNTMLCAAEAACDFYIEQTPTDGIPYWDTGAPGLTRMGDYLSKPSDPFNDFEPVDSSAAAIAAQGLCRLGNYLLKSSKPPEAADRYRQAALVIAKALFDKPYLSEDTAHQGLILHSLYHYPNGWDRVPPGSRIPSGESSMWGDYHARELALLLLRETRGEPYLTFFNF